MSAFVHPAIRVRSIRTGKATGALNTYILDARKAAAVRHSPSVLSSQTATAEMRGLAEASNAQAPLLHIVYSWPAGHNIRADEILDYIDAFTAFAGAQNNLYLAAAHFDAAHLHGHQALVNVDPRTHRSTIQDRFARVIELFQGREPVRAGKLSEGARDAETYGGNASFMRYLRTEIARLAPPSAAKLDAALAHQGVLRVPRKGGFVFVDTTATPPLAVRASKLGLSPALRADLKVTPPLAVVPTRRFQRSYSERAAAGDLPAPELALDHRELRAQYNARRAAGELANVQFGRFVRRMRETPTATSSDVIRPTYGLLPPRRPLPTKGLITMSAIGSEVEDFLNANPLLAAEFIARTTHPSQPEPFSVLYLLDEANGRSKRLILSPAVSPGRADRIREEIEARGVARQINTLIDEIFIPSIDRCEVEDRDGNCVLQFDGTGTAIDFGKLEFDNSKEWVNALASTHNAFVEAGRAGGKEPYTSYTRMIDNHIDAYSKRNRLNEQVAPVNEVPAPAPDERAESVEGLNIFQPSPADELAVLQPNDQGFENKTELEKAALRFQKEYANAMGARLDANPLLADSLARFEKANSAVDQRYKTKANDPTRGRSLDGLESINDQIAAYREKAFNQDIAATEIGLYTVYLKPWMRETYRGFLQERANHEPDALTAQRIDALVEYANEREQKEVRDLASKVTPFAYQDKYRAFADLIAVRDAHHPDRIEYRATDRMSAKDLEGGNLRQHSTVLFHEHNDVFHVPKRDEQALDAALTLANDRWGAVKLRGTDAYVEAALERCVALDIKVSDMTPIQAKKYEALRAAHVVDRQLANAERPFVLPEFITKAQAHVKAATPGPDVQASLTQAHLTYLKSVLPQTALATLGARTVRDATAQKEHGKSRTGVFLAAIQTGEQTVAVVREGHSGLGVVPMTTPQDRDIVNDLKYGQPVQYRGGDQPTISAIPDKQQQARPGLDDRLFAHAMEAQILEEREPSDSPPDAQRENGEHAAYDQEDERELERSGGGRSL